MKTIITALNRSLPLTARFEINIHNSPYPALSIQGIGRGPRALPAINVFQHRLRGGQLLRHPEMRFEVDLHLGIVADLLPFCWRSEYDELEEYSVLREGFEPDGRLIIRVNAARLADQRDVARDWDLLLAAQGFENAYSRALLLPPASKVAHA